MNLRTLSVGLTGFCAFLSLYATQPLLPLLMRNFRASQLAVSLTVSAATLAVALAAPWVGILADQQGRKKVIVPALYLLGLATLLTGLADSLPALILWRFIQGLLTPMVFAVTVAYVSEEWPHHEAGFATSVYVTGTVVGGFTGRYLSGLVADALGWQWVFLVLGFLILLLTLGIAQWLPLARRFKKVEDTSASLRHLREHLGNPSLLAVNAVGFVVLFSLVGTFTYITFYLADAPFGLRTSALGSLFFVYLVGAVITPLAGRRVDRMNLSGTLALSLLVSAAGVGLTLIQHLTWVIVGVSLCCSGVFVCQTVANKMVGATAGKAKASAVGLYVTFYYLGGFMGSVVPGLLWKWGKWPACVGLLSGVLVLTAVLVFLFFKKGARLPVGSPQLQEWDVPA
jgi:predicted MFS family arabinose efflux permease